MIEQFTVFLSVIQVCFLCCSSYIPAFSKCSLYSRRVQIIVLIHWVSSVESQLWMNLMIWYLCRIHIESYGFFLQIELNYLWCHRVSVEILWLEMMAAQ